VLYNVVGGIAWVGLFLFAGFLFGNVPVVQKNFSVVILVIIAISVMPILIEWLRARREKQQSGEGPK
jgi:membrane-associated protein